MQSNIMEGNIIVYTESGENSFPMNEDNLSALVTYLSDQEILVTKLIFENISAQTSDMNPVFKALKNNRSLTEIQFNHAHLDAEYLKNEIATLVDLPIDALTNANSGKEPSTTSQTDPRKIISALTLSRNYTLKVAKIDDKEIIPMGIEVNRSLASWDPGNTNIHDLYRFLGSYYLSLATQFDIQKQYANAFNYAIYGNMMLKQIPVISQNTKDQHTIVNFDILLGSLYAKKEMWELAEKRYNEAALIEDKKPENDRTDENWRNLLIINAAVAKIEAANKKPSDTIDCFNHVISALICFCRMKEKTSRDYGVTSEAAELISNMGNATAAFIYHTIFDKTNTKYNISEKISEVKLELRANKQDKMRYLLIELLIFILKEQISTHSSLKPMNEYLNVPANKKMLEKALIDLTILDKYSTPAASDRLISDETPKIKKTATSYYGSFFDARVKSQRIELMIPDERVKPNYV